MDRLSPPILAFALMLIVGLSSCEEPEKGHDLLPLEEALAGSWQHDWKYLRSPGPDQEVLELLPDRTGALKVLRTGNYLTSDSYVVEDWEVANDTLVMDMMKPGYTLPIPGREDRVVDTVRFQMDFALLWLSADSVILNEQCDLNKRYCDGVVTWLRRETLAEMLTPDSLQSTEEGAVKRLRQK